MSRWDDEDIRLVPRGSTVTSSVAALLRKLQLSDAPFDAQAAGIAQWLRTNDPVPAMEYSLRAKGFSRLLDERASA
ncbi:hypothetical protein [Mycolicibacterium brumae]|uniref:Uncharacterized protein n=1 Tax=Mycolicibacterium brumae TaxID=85968 RepID=A0A2G5PDB6_9MYCO|nr:hypothetical protein [Mycolicibacterium brumae]MCV7191799.1 hypothetical protein [Mycolicibacterium brumae]PIB76318.1 hypothetical protein CQY22_006270 [Mycolicibacterium brumae]RWA15824.1 hypothetical protein MBRU_09755 [Mycolicibacterium brumae DSM 44177]UWW07105.1 hypothetical protein L2Z93_000094 [Mycolicibacterium brumae]